MVGPTDQVGNTICGKFGTPYNEVGGCWVLGGQGRYGMGMQLPSNSGRTKEYKSSTNSAVCIMLALHGGGEGNKLVEAVWVLL